MNIDELTLGQIKKLKSIFSTEGTGCCEDLGTNIVVLQRGWVVVGKLKKEGVSIHFQMARLFDEQGAW